MARRSAALGLPRQRAASPDLACSQMAMNTARTGGRIWKTQLRFTPRRFYFHLVLLPCSAPLQASWMFVRVWVRHFCAGTGYQESWSFWIIPYFSGISRSCNSSSSAPATAALFAGPGRFFCWRKSSAATRTARLRFCLQEGYLIISGQVPPAPSGCCCFI